MPIYFYLLDIDISAVILTWSDGSLSIHLPLLFRTIATIAPFYRIFIFISSLFARSHYKKYSIDRRRTRRTTGMKGKRGSIR